MPTLRGAASLSTDTVDCLVRLTERLGHGDNKHGAMGEHAIGTSLRAARERLGWSREALAYHAGVSWSAIAQIETGRRTDIRLSSLSALARALGLSIDHLVGHPARPAAPTLEHQALVYGSDTEFLSAVIPF